MIQKLLLYVFLFFFIFAPGMTAQEEEMMMLNRDMMKIQAKDEKPIGIIYVDATTGDDADGKGTEIKPYRTITRALEVAYSGDTIQVGPGVYAESLSISAPDRIRIYGSGSASTTIDGYVWVDWCDEFRIDGFTITGAGAAGASALWCDNVDIAVVSNCIFDCPDAGGIVARLATHMWVYDTPINSPEGVGALAHSASYLFLTGCTISGCWTGIVSKVGAFTYIDRCTISDSESRGVTVEQNARLYLQRGNSIFNNPFGIWIQTGALVESYGGPGGDVNRIHSNTSQGIHLRTGGIADIVRHTEIYNNSDGILAEGASILKLSQNTVSVYGNIIGVDVIEYAHAFLGQADINGNDLDVLICTGGQAICDPTLIGTIESDCITCQK